MAEIDPEPASATTRSAHRAAAAVLSFDDPADTDRATRGRIGSHPTGRIELDGNAVWDIARHDFLRHGAPAPDTVHPGLWRQATLNAHHGLFEVADGVWQARGYDISNITFLAGRTGWVIIDPLTTTTTAAACLELANDILGERRVAAVIYTHSHVDHFGGVLGVTSPEAVARGDVRVIAPDGFLHEVVRENVIAGPIMTRRAMYQFGPLLANGPVGQVDCGLGSAIPLGPVGLIAPTETIHETGTELTVDGIRIVFQNTPEAEAPAEMNFFFPDKALLCMAENCTHTLHNVYPIRGAQTRDALYWSKYIAEALELWGDDTDTMFASHHWPRFGTSDVRRFLVLQRDVYRWMHDQTMRLANLGHTPTEIAEALSLPACFARDSHVQGYYGTVSHNAKSVYTRYLGWYDGNPANLDPLPPVEAGERYVELMGGADAVMAAAQRAFDNGDYRWVAQVVNHVVFADPDHTAARRLQADALEQLGYRSESATWRNAYLMGAHELRHGTPDYGAPRGRLFVHAMTAEQIFDSMGVRFDPEAFGDADGTSSLVVNVTFTDLDEHHVLGVVHAALHQRPFQHAPDADAALTCSRAALADVLGRLATLDDQIEAGTFDVSGDVDALRRLFDSLTVFTTQRLIEP